MGCVNGWMGGWYGRVDLWTVCMDRRMNGWINGLHEWMDGWMNGNSE
jgi:hypothetical protein